MAGICAPYICLVLAVFAAGQHVARSQTRTVREPLPRDAIPAILDSFEQYPIVALGEDHRNQQVHDFIGALVNSPDFPNRVNDIVVEFGAARYQGLVDRYVAGEAVPLDQLCWAWRDAVNILVWDAPVYQTFFETIRTVNQRLPQRRRLRVLLADPVFDWTRVHTKEEWERLALQRDSHAFTVIEREVLEKGHRALLVFGSGHLMRERAYDRYGRSRKEKLNLTELLGKKYPGRVFVIWPHTGNWGEISGIDARLELWPKPSLVLLQGTWLGLTAVGEPGNSPRMQELADALLYVGAVASQTESKPVDAIYADPAYLRELLRRDRIQGGHNKSELQRLVESAGFAQ